MGVSVGMGLRRTAPTARMSEREISPYEHGVGGTCIHTQSHMCDLRERPCIVTDDYHVTYVS